MEIRVTAQMRGTELRDRILERWGSVDALEEEADAGNGQAKDDLFTLERLEEDPDRLEGLHERTTITVLEPGELARLTEKRLDLLDHLATDQRALNVSQLAREVERDKKNVSRDLELLGAIGLVERIEQGREKLVRLAGTRMSIELTPEGSAKV